MKARKKGHISPDCVYCDPAKLPGGSPVFPFERPIPMPADQARTISLGWPAPIQVSWAPSNPRPNIRRRTQQQAPAAAAVGPERPRARVKVRAVPAADDEASGQAAVKAHAEEASLEMPTPAEEPESVPSRQAVSASEPVHIAAAETQPEPAQAGAAESSGPKPVHAASPQDHVSEPVQGATPDDAVPTPSRAPVSTQTRRSPSLRRPARSAAQVIQQVGSVIRHR